MPKRKAQEDDFHTAEPSPKRATRASTRLNDAESKLATSSRRSSTRISNAPPQSNPVLQSSLDDTQLDAPVQPTRARKKPSAARGSPLKKTASSSPSKRNRTQNLGTVTNLHDQEESGDDDELNLSPSKLGIRCETPPSRAGRVLMHSVEITTPRTFPKLNPTASPAPTMRKSPAKSRITPAGIAYDTLELAAALPSRPSTVRPNTPTRHTKQIKRLPNTPSVDTPQAKSPDKSQLPPSRPPSPTRIPRNLPPYLCTCLRLQKSAILTELQHCSMESDEDISLGPTNTAAFRQLKDLLIGTVSRGEGNSCFVLGPRGSGKTTVSLPNLPVSYALKIYVLSLWSEL